VCVCACVCACVCVCVCVRERERERKSELPQRENHSFAHTEYIDTACLILVGIFWEYVGLVYVRMYEYSGRFNVWMYVYSGLFNVWMHVYMGFFWVCIYMYVGIFWRMQVYIYRALFCVSNLWREKRDGMRTLEKGYDRMMDYLREK